MEIGDKILLKENVLEIYNTISLVIDEETKNFLINIKNLEVIFRGYDKESMIVKISVYDNTKTFNLPLECVSSGIIEDKEENIGNFYRKYERLINILGIIAIILILLITYSLKEKSKPIIKEKTAIEINIDTQKMNLDLIQEKLNKQKIIKGQIKDLQENLSKNIGEIKTLEINNSNLREQYILETNK